MVISRIILLIRLFPVAKLIVEYLPLLVAGFACFEILITIDLCVCPVMRLDVKRFHDLSFLRVAH